MKRFDVQRTNGGLRIIASPETSRDILAVLDVLVDLVNSIKIDSLRREAIENAKDVRETAKRGRQFDRMARKVYRCYSGVLSAFPDDLRYALKLVSKEFNLLVVNARFYVARGKKLLKEGKAP